MTEYKQKWSEFQSDLQQQLKAAKKVRMVVKIEYISGFLSRF